MTKADVTMVLEGTYPYVAGGVSSWIHQIISGLPELTFNIVFLGPARGTYDKKRYTLPENVIHFEEHYLSDVPKGDRVITRRGDVAFHRGSVLLHDAMRGDGDLPTALGSAVKELLRSPTEHRDDFLFSELSWDEICARYEATASDRSFLEYFWTIRSMHAPLFLVAEIAARVPPSRCAHVISTGYAGFLGMLLHQAWQRPLVLTEHGIYTKERRIELLQASWIKDDDDVSVMAENASIGIFRQLWVRFFESLGKMTYSAASPILSLYEGNRARQIHDGASAERTRVVPNGIALERLAPLRSQRPSGIPEVVALIGRVVPIKDIKTFLRAMRVVCTRLPKVVGWIAGPEDEDRGYATECRELAKSLGLEGRVEFLGFRKLDELWPKIGVNVLTSISEAQPLVVLEGFAAGVPSVASDVGCCRELILGASPEDSALGAAGAIVDIADPDATANEICALLSDPRRWTAAQRAGIARVERYYTEKQMIDRYRDIYRQAMG
jgi:glycosyltransferase involved in cell wall biosynthesis